MVESDVFCSRYRKGGNLGRREVNFERPTRIQDEHGCVQKK